MRRQLQYLKNVNQISSDFNYLSNENNAKVVFCSSQLKACPSSNLIVNERSSIWLSEKNIPQLLIFDLANLFIRPKEIKYLGIYCWHAYNTNPKRIELSLSKDNKTYFFWGKYHMTLKSGNQYFAIKPVDLTKYKYLKLSINETYGGTKTYMNNVYLFEALPENKKFYPDLHEKKVKVDMYNTNLLTSEIDENKQENMKDLEEKQDIMKNDLNQDLVSTNKLEFESINNNQSLKNDVLKLNTSNTSFINKLTLSKMAHPLETVEMKTLDNQLHEMESQLQRLQIDHDLKSNYLITRDDRTSKSDLQTSNYFNSKNNFTVESSKGNFITRNSNYVKNNQVCLSSNRSDNIFMLEEKISKMETYLIELKKEYKEMKEKEDNLKNLNSISNEKNSNLKDGGIDSYIQELIEKRLKDLFQGFETKIKSSIESAIKSNLNEKKGSPFFSKEQELRTSLIDEIESNQGDEEKIEIKVNDIQELCEKLQNKLLEKEKKLQLLQKETSKSSKQ